MGDSVSSDPRPVKQRLLEAGEELFAEHGWNGVSIRTIAAKAEVSLAALNYHFGEKEKLLAEIFAARARPIAAERIRLLEALRADGDLSLETVIEAFLSPALTVSTEFGGRVFIKLRARLATEPVAFSRRILADAFDEFEPPLSRRAAGSLAGSRAGGPGLAVPFLARRDVVHHGRSRPHSIVDEWRLRPERRPGCASPSRAVPGRRIPLGVTRKTSSPRAAQIIVPRRRTWTCIIQPRPE